MTRRLKCLEQSVGKTLKPVAVRKLLRVMRLTQCVETRQKNQFGWERSIWSRWWVQQKRLGKDLRPFLSIFGNQIGKVKKKDETCLDLRPFLSIFGNQSEKERRDIQDCNNREVIIVSSELTAQVRTKQKQEEMVKTVGVVSVGRPCGLNRLKGEPLNMCIKRRHWWILAACWSRSARRRKSWNDRRVVWN